MRKEQERKYKVETAKVSSVRLASAKQNPYAPHLPRLENAREVILKLIEAIKRL